jgi:hypothetical protein
MMAVLVVSAIGWREARAAEAPHQKPESAAKAADGPAAQQALSKEAVALRDRIRRTLALYFHQPVNTADNTPADILAFCLAYGCDTEVRYGSSAGQAASGLGCLCWNYPCAGYQLLTLEGQRPVARMGYGLQAYPSQLLGVLAASAVPAKYQVRIGTFQGTVADLVAAEQLDCRSGSDLSHKLIGMAFYVPEDQTWKNRLGETWSVERLLKEELARPFDLQRADAVNRLMGISYAVERRRRLGKPLGGEFARAEEYLAQFQEYALGLQTPEGTWHPLFFAARGASNDAWGTLRSTGFIGEWLALSLPKERLAEPRMVKTVGWLANWLETGASRWNATAATPREIESIGHALHALRIYDERVFKPHDAAPADAAAGRSPENGPAEK